MDLESKSTRGSVENRLRYYLLASLFAALTAVGAFIKIPLPYVPITLQPVFVILAGSVLGPKYGALSQLIYLGAGLSGAPIFANGGGPAYVLQPTFGYLVGYPIGAYIVGVLVHRSPRHLRSGSHIFLLLCVAGFTGMMIILIVGASGLYFNFKFIAHKPISISTLFFSYFLFFIPGDIIKVILSSLTALKLQRIISFHSHSR